MGHVERMGYMRNIYTGMYMRKVCSENLKGRDHLGNLDVEGSVILKWTLKKRSVIMWTGFI
jgi:hypothetical protein